MLKLILVSQREYNNNKNLTLISAVVTCNTPPTVSNAVYSQLDGDIEYGARVQYTCSTGYNIDGNDTISCLLNASWSLPTPSCSLVDCGNPGVPVNGYTNDNVFTYQSTVQYYCNEGYQLSGDSSIECTANGNWNNTLPNCVIINCTDPGTPTNGTRNGVDIYYNSTVSYNCNTGYNLTGTASITCNATGQWNGSVPLCIAIGMIEIFIFSNFLNFTVNSNSYTKVNSMDASKYKSIH